MSYRRQHHGEISTHLINLYGCIRTLICNRADTSSGIPVVWNSKTILTTWWSQVLLRLSLVPGSRNPKILCAKTFPHVYFKRVLVPISCNVLRCIFSKIVTSYNLYNYIYQWAIGSTLNAFNLECGLQCAHDFQLMLS